MYKYLFLFLVCNFLVFCRKDFYSLIEEWFTVNSFHFRDFSLLMKPSDEVIFVFCRVLILQPVQVEGVSWLLEVNWNIFLPFSNLQSQTVTFSRDTSYTGRILFPIPLSPSLMLFIAILFMQTCKSAFWEQRGSLHIPTNVNFNCRLMEVPRHTGFMFWLF